MAQALTYGFFSLQDLFNQRIQEVGVERVWEAVRESLAEYNRVSGALTSNFVEMTTVAQVAVELPGTGTLQPITPDGNPLPVVPSGRYTVGFPIKGGATAWGTNRVTRQMLTVEEADRFTSDAFLKDADWKIRHVLAAIFGSASYAFHDAVGPSGAAGIGSINVYGLANGDSVVYNKKGGNVAATDNHYLSGTATSITDSFNPFPTIRAELMEHPSNSGPFVSYIPTNLVDDVATLTEFIEVNDPDVLYQNTDNLPNAPAAILGMGDEIIGKLKSSNIWLVEWSRLPDNYIITHAIGSGPFLRQREYPAEALQGLFQEGFSPDGNHQEQRFIRFSGFGVYDRIAAAVYQVGTSTYAVPSGFLPPLAI
jgi:hypothetical protein